MRWTRGRGRVGSDVQKRFILVLVLWQSTPVPFGVFLQKKSPLNPLALFTLQALLCLVEHGDVGKAAQVCPVMDAISFDGRRRRCGLEEDIIRGVEWRKSCFRAIPFGSLGRTSLAPSLILSCLAWWHCWSGRESIIRRRGEVNGLPASPEEVK